MATKKQALERATYVILRGGADGTRDIFRGGVRPESLGGPAELKVEVERLDRAGVARVAQLGSVQAIARAMPMRLIAPVAKPKAARPVAGGMSWGIGAVGADVSAFNGHEAVVAVLDTGIDPAHPAFAGVNLVQKDFTGEGNGDNHGHGTHCAGTIFGRAVGGQRIGVAPGVAKALIGKVLGGNGGSSDVIANAIQWAVENGANVVSMSLGIDFPGFVDQLVKQNGMPIALATSYALEGYRANVQLFEKLAALVRTQSLFGRAALIVAAAGNESERDTDPNFEISVSPPAVAEGIISVAALGQSPKGLVVAPFSNTGANIAAPGVNVVSAKAGGGLASMSGTSMATPHVAGVAALWYDKIKAEAGSVATATFGARLIASGVSKGLRPGIDMTDVGAGLVRAPKN